MTTQVIGIKEFRKNLTSISKEAQRENKKFIVMNHSKPILEVNPISEDTLIYEELKKDTAEARSQIKKGDTLSHQEVIKSLGL
jgi:predicted phosphohydrolase